MWDGKSDSLTQSPSGLHSSQSSASSGHECVSSSLDRVNSPAQTSKCTLVDVDFLFPSTWGNSAAYQRLRHLRAIEASALNHQLKRHQNSTEDTAIRRIDALLEIQRRECFRLDGVQLAPPQGYTYAYGIRNGDGEPVRKEYVRDRAWPPKEFALKNTPKTGPGRGGGRKRKIPEKTPAQMDEERLVMDFGKTCIDCGTQNSPLWRQVDAAVEIPQTAPDQIVIIPKEDICLMCYVQRTCGAKVRAQLTKKKKEKTIKAKEEAKAKKAPVTSPTVEIVSTENYEQPVDDQDDASTEDEKRSKKSSKKSSKKKKKKSKKSSSSVPVSPTSPKALKPPLSPKKTPLAPLIIEDDAEQPPPLMRSSRKESSKKRSRDSSVSPHVTPKSKSSKREVPVVAPLETPREKELRAKGQYCPVCNLTYEDDDASEFVCCDSCEMWVHSLCDPQLTAERMKELAEPEAKYIGPCCANSKKRR
ncbi:hypothetical protein AC1031_018706 [Aphanomyces cochlioides]|nr:hypothetical protein AC1031_018706 [Aphanomyces cochlioides]